MNTNKVTTIKPKTVQVKQSATLGPVEELRKSAQAEGERRALIKEFVATQLQQGIDYGQIDIYGKSSKPTLFKPGMEKIFSLFNIVSELEKDEDTLSMITTKDVVAYRCRLYRNGTFVGEGRGACAISERGRVNDSIKIAEKRARMDACLNLGFSEYFTQDLEDMDKDPVIPSKPAVTAYKKTEEISLTFIVEGVEEKTARSGNRYAELITNMGKAIAFKEAVDKFEQGNIYQARGWWEEKGGRRVFIITSQADGIKQVQAPKELADPELAPF
jgi:hypothetical protein